MPATNKKQTAKKSVKKEVLHNNNTNNDNTRKYIKAINALLKKLDEESLYFYMNRQKFYYIIWKYPNFRRNLKNLMLKQ